MSQMTAIGYQQFTQNIWGLSHDVREQKKGLKFERQGILTDFMKRLSDCQFQFSQIQYPSVASSEVLKLARKELDAISRILNKNSPTTLPTPSTPRITVTSTPRTGPGTPLRSLSSKSMHAKTLQGIAEQFKKHNTYAAVESFSKFEQQFPDVANQVFESLWTLKGSKQDPSRSYKKDLFFGKNGHYALDIEKAEALLAITSTPIQRLRHIQTLFAENKEEEPLVKFAELSCVYPKIADCIYRKVWELYDRPTEHHQAHLAHDHFGDLAFHNRHPNPNFKVQWGKNIEAIELALNETTLNSPVFLTEQDIQRRNHRCVEVANETVELFKAGSYKTYCGQTHDLATSCAFSTAHSRLYKSAGADLPKKPRFTETTFEVRSQNCVEMGYDLSFNGGNTLILNLANALKPGGKYLESAGTQEEELFRCTGIAPVIHQIHDMQKQNFYPIHDLAGLSGGIYSPRVPIIRMGMKNDYQFYEQPMPVAIASFSAYVNPKLDVTDPSNPRLQGEELKWTREKIRTIYHMAYENGHDTLVLGALGCGAFGNPPQHIAELFIDVYNKEFKGCFKYVGFAVLEDKNKGKVHNPEGNFQPFARLIQENGGTAQNANGEVISKIN